MFVKYLKIFILLLNLNCFLNQINENIRLKIQKCKHTKSIPLGPNFNSSFKELFILSHETFILYTKGYDIHLLKIHVLMAVAVTASADLEVQLVQLNHCDGECSKY